MTVQRAQLDAGDHAWAIVAEPSGRDRHTLVGTAYVEVIGEARDNVLRCRVVRASNTGILLGHVFEFDRRFLYKEADRVEHNAFGAAVSRLWGHP